MTDYRKDGPSLTVFLDERIDTSNSEQVRTEVDNIISAESHDNLILDLDRTAYVSSSGLRIILGLIKKEKSIKAINVGTEVYEILEMTGFTELFPVEKAWKKLSVEGCEVIGKGAKGTVFRYDPETIVKVYHNPDSLPVIQRERELARKAFVLGIPTAISYDVVKVGETFGSVFELLSAKSFSQLIAENPEDEDRYVIMYAELLKQIHETAVDEKDFPNIKMLVFRWLDDVKAELPENTWSKLKGLIEAAEDRATLIHGDYHTNNLMLQDGETLLIDMDTLAYGYPVFELANVHVTLKGFGKINPKLQEDFLGIPYELIDRMWDVFLPAYFDTEDKAFLEDAEKKIKLVSNLRQLRHVARRPDDEFSDRMKAACREEIIKLTDEIETLEFIS